jgi:uncharacterized membrane protein YdbT with pleckstrin-like domain
MASIAQQLQPNETIVYRTHPTRIGLYTVLFLAGVTLFVGAAAFQTIGDPLVLLIAGVIFVPLLVLLIQKWVVISSCDYVLTSRRVIKQTGIVSKNSVTSYLDKINNVEHKQSLWGRMMNYGDVEIDTASETGLTVFPSVAAPLEFKKAILIASEELRSGRAAPLAAQTSAGERMRELKGLLDDGLISADEYEVKRRKLLEEM